MAAENRQNGGGASEPIKTNRSVRNRECVTKKIRDLKRCFIARKPPVMDFESFLVIKDTLIKVRNYLLTSIFGK